MRFWFDTWWYDWYWYIDIYWYVCNQQLAVSCLFVFYAMALCCFSNNHNPKWSNIGDLEIKLLLLFHGTWCQKSKYEPTGGSISRESSWGSTHCKKQGTDCFTSRGVKTLNYLPTHTAQKLWRNKWKVVVPALRRTGMLLARTGKLHRTHMLSYFGQHIKVKYSRATMKVQPLLIHSTNCTFIYQVPKTEEDIRATIRSMIAGKSPGLDGLPVEYYKRWIDKLVPIRQKVHMGTHLTMHFVDT